MDVKEYFKGKKLLADGKSNAKMAKNSMKTYGLSLIPHTLNSSGVNLCKFSTKECRAVCLNSSGHGGFTAVQEARRKKADFFVEHREEFLNKLYAELLQIDKKGLRSAVRLNVISDVDWEEEFRNFGKSLKDFQNIQFYGYTKNPFMIEDNDNPNYNFTFSYSGGNWGWCEKFLKERTANVSVVFKNALPLKWRGWDVINGDESDERFLEQKGVIIGLKYKIPRGVKYTPNKFVVDEEASTKRMAKEVLALPETV